MTPYTCHRSHNFPYFAQIPTTSYNYPNLPQITLTSHESYLPPAIFPIATNVNYFLQLFLLPQIQDKSHLPTLREESSQTNVILQYTLLAAILSAVCSVIQQS